MDWMDALYSSQYRTVHHLQDHHKVGDSEGDSEGEKVNSVNRERVNVRTVVTYNNGVKLS